MSEDRAAVVTGRRAVSAGPRLSPWRNAVEPGDVATDFYDTEQGAKTIAWITAKIPTGNSIDPESVARAIVELGSPDNRHTTGSIVRIDGGLTATL